MRAPFALRALAMSLASAGSLGAQRATPLVPTLTTPAVDATLTAPAAKLTPQEVTAMQHTLADWPQLARYRDENARLGPPARGEERVVFFGDSITDVWGRQHGRFFPDRPWINRGISGQTTPQMLVRFRADVFALQPAAVVILAGINDIAGNTGITTLAAIEDNFRSMTALAEAAGIRVVLSSLLPTSRIPSRPGADPRGEVVALNAWLRRFAAEQHLTYLDYYDALLGPDHGTRADLTLDGLHPNDAGYAVMEPLARAAVAAALAKPRR